MGIGKDRGEYKTMEAVRQAVTSKLLETSIEGATGIILNIKGGLDLALEEVYEAADLVKEVVDPSCNIIFGSGIEENMEDEVEITVIATGFSGTTLTDDMKKDIIRSVSNDIEKANDYVHQTSEHSQDVKVNNLYEENIMEEDQDELSLEDEDIPPFLRKIKRNRF